MKSLRACRTARFFAVVLLLMLGLPGAVLGGWSGFLRLDGATGESQDTNHVGWMDVSVASVASLSNNPSPPAGGPPVSQGSLCFLKRVDKASPVLMLKCAQGALIPTGTLDLTSTNASLVQFLRLNLTNVTITSVKPAGQGNSLDAHPSENVCLLAQIQAWNYTQFSPASGLPRSYAGSFWDFSAGRGGSNVHGPVFLVTGIRRTSGVQLSWPATAGRQYTIYAVSRLDLPFTPVSTVTATATGPLTQDFPANAPAMFFVVVEQP